MSQPADQVTAIDVHAHVAPPCVGTETAWEWQRKPLRRQPDGTLEIGSDGDRRPLPWPQDGEHVEARLDYMDSVGVDMQVLSLSPALWDYGLDGHDSVWAARQVNQDLTDMATAHPTRFRVFAHLPLDDVDAAVAELERAMSHDLVVGAAVGTHVDGRNWDHPKLFPVLEAAERLGALLFFHPASVRFIPDMPDYHLRNLIGNPTETTVTIGSLLFGGVLDRLSDLRALFAHGGGYAAFAAGRFDHGHRERTDVRANTEGAIPSRCLHRLYFDNLLHSDAAMRYLIETVGLSQVVLGTDYPADMGPRDPVRPVLDSAAFTDAEKRAVLGANLAELIGVDLSQAGPTPAATAADR
jgi:aminocarboxymuconate-semialdehyde decarboxylase